MKINSTNNEAPSDDVTIDLDMFCALMEDRMKVDADSLKKKKGDADSIVICMHVTNLDTSTITTQCNWTISLEAKDAN